MVTIMTTEERPRARGLTQPVAVGLLVAPITLAFSLLAWAGLQVVQTRNQARALGEVLAHTQADFEAAKAERAGIDARLEATSISLAATRTESARMSSELAAASTKLRRAEARIEEKSKELDAIRAEQTKGEKERIEATTKLEAAQAKLEQSTTRLGAVQAKLDEATGELARTRMEQAGVIRDLQARNKAFEDENRGLRARRSAPPPVDAQGRYYCFRNTTGQSASCEVRYLDNGKFSLLNEYGQPDEGSWDPSTGQIKVSTGSAVYFPETGTLAIYYRPTGQVRYWTKSR